jgi:hypothetical protein
MLWKAHSLKASGLAETHLIHYRRALDAQRRSPRLGVARHAAQPPASRYLVSRPHPKRGGAPNRKRMGVGIIYHALPTGTAGEGFR